jgi:hypothetical protein
MMVMDYEGAMWIGEGAWSTKRVLCNGEGASAALSQKRKGRRRQTLSVEVKIPLVTPPGFIDPWSHAPRIARSACINCRRTTQSLMGGTHHDRSGQAHAHARSLRRGNQRAAGAVMSARPRRPLRARPRRLKRRARSARLWMRRWALNGPVPYPVRMTLERPEHKARKPRPSKGAITDQWTRSPLSVNGCHRCPRSTRTTDQRFEGQPGYEPSEPADAKSQGGPAATPQWPY